MSEDITVIDEPLPDVPDAPEPEDMPDDDKKIRRVPIFARVLFCVFGVALAVHIVSFLSVDFANFFNEKISAFLRMILAKITGILPFSLAETIIIALPVLIVVIIVVFVTTQLKNKRKSTRFLVVMFAVAATFYSMFVLNFGTGYRNSPLDQKLGIERSGVTARELYDTALLLNEDVARVSEEIDFPLGGGSSSMPYGLSEMNDRLNAAYDVLCEKYTFIPGFHSKLKYIALSKPMVYTHISGVYSYYTGESNVNVAFPPYTVVYSAAHEMAHQRGIAREDEANFVAFLACASSDDAYIRYCGYQSMLEYVINALYSADRELYGELYSQLCPESITEMQAYNEFFEPYRKTVISDVSSAVNDTYLKALGQKDGEKSYGMVVDLAVAYYLRGE